ncbi:MAG TPA: 3-dehydroquinate synthase [Bacillota bacterium]
MEKIELDLGKRSYQILVGQGILAETGRLIREKGLKGRVMVVTNPTVAGLYLEMLRDSLEAAGYAVDTFLIPDSETAKSLEQANQIYDRLAELEYDRKSILIALGGGVVGDLTGFVAATYLRGLRFVQVPTTLLAQVDSSVGGKVAVNHFKGKNLIGCFYQPELVISDVGVLKTLPQLELSSGMAEVIKHGIILDAHYYQLILGELKSIREANPEIMTWVVIGSCKIKADVVHNDETETGLRTILNFGHTIGHACESITRYEYYKHGEAVALGMLAAVRIADRLQLLEDTGLESSLTQMLQELNLPVTLPGLAVDELIHRLYLDKKVEYGKLRWVMPQRIGKVTVTTAVPESVVAEVLIEMGGVR